MSNSDPTGATLGESRTRANSVFRLQQWWLLMPLSLPEYVARWKASTLTERAAVHFVLTCLETASAASEGMLAPRRN